tara:strand:+ start:813 stop:971 length:159 start_codon:yes stop_codon:yes gene_type:complete
MNLFLAMISPYFILTKMPPKLVEKNRTNTTMCGYILRLAVEVRKPQKIDKYI